MNENLILIVDDDPCWRTALEMFLQHRGFPVISADTGVQAIEAAIARRPSLIVMDVNMPGMSGYEVTRAMRGCEEIAEVPIVGASANNDDATRIRAFEAGMNDFVSKPWADSDIDRALQRISAGPKGPPTNNERFHL